MIAPGVRSVLSVLHAPSYAPRIGIESVRRACATGVDSIGWTEAYAVVPALRRRVSYRCKVGRSSIDTRAVPSLRGDAGDVPVLVRRRWPVVEWRAHLITPPGNPRKYAPERWLTEVVYDHAIGEVVHLAAHPDPRFVDGGLWSGYMARLQSRVVLHQRRGRHVVLTGDLQHARLGEWFDQVDLDYWRIGIDYVGHSPHLRMVERARLTDPAQVDVQDPHPWLLARFTL